MNRPQFARYLPARENGLKRGIYEQQALSRRIQDRVVYMDSDLLLRYHTGDWIWAVDTTPA